MNRPKYEIPADLQGLLLEFTVNVLVEQPTDLIDFAADYFTKLRENRPPPPSPAEGSGNTNRPPPPLLITESDESVLTDDDDEPMPEPPLNRYNRRKSVFAEHYDPEADDEDENNKLVFPKTDEQRQRLSESVKNIFLFSSLDPEQMLEVLDAMFEKKVTVNEFVIKQGDDGDNFYVIDSGVYNIFVTAENNENKLIGNYDNCGSFGELALMYNMPRAATIQAVTEGSLWALDRVTFRRILLKNAFKKRKMYEALLESVPMLKALEAYERMNLADALAPKTCEDGERIIQQGDSADGMYFIEDGTVRISMMGENGVENEVTRVTKGGYFGELALVTHKPRAASVYAVGKVRLAFLDVQAFERLLGPCMEIMKRNIEDYEEQLVKLFGSKTNLNDAR